MGENVTPHQIPDPMRDLSVPPFSSLCHSLGTESMGPVPLGSLRYQGTIITALAK